MAIIVLHGCNNHERDNAARVIEGDTGRRTK